MLRELGDMVAFAAVVREGSFTAAARALGMTKQSVSERVSSLEQRLGVQLLVRTTRLLRLTEVGERYHEACVEVVSRAEAADRDAKLAQSRPVGSMRVTCPVGLARAFLMPVVAEYRRLHPSVRFEVLLEERVVDLVQERIDVAIRAGTVQPTSTLMARPLFEVDVVYVASVAYLGRHGTPKVVADVARADCITRRGGESWSVAGQSVTPRSALHVNTFEGALDAAIAGLGVARVPALLAEEYERSGVLRRLFDAGARIKFTALWPAKRLPVKTRVFLDLLLARAKDVGTAKVASARAR